MQFAFCPIVAKVAKAAGRENWAQQQNATQPKTRPVSIPTEFQMQILIIFQELDFIICFVRAGNVQRLPCRALESHYKN